MKTKRRKPSKKTSPMDRKAGPLRRTFKASERLMGQTELYEFQSATFNEGVIKQLWREHRIDRFDAIILMQRHIKTVKNCFKDFKNYSDTANAIVKAEG